ncbi:MAG: hypothetical protein K2X93_04355 [Candidatus Obscuribacterales bacterium]|nr:hypothetical protein [Candidatus Obscuribacterales bacterium]
MKSRTRRGAKSQRGASLVEVTAGLFLIVPLFLCIIDLSAIVLGQITNDTLVKRVARAAAHEANSSAAGTAASTIITSFGGSEIVSNPQLVALSYNAANNGIVVAETRLTIKVPAPVPFVPLLQTTRVMNARATEPIVMLPANP